MGEAERPELADTVAGWSGGDGNAAILERGAEVGRYLVLELLGSGGMGAVYAAYDPELDRKVALKLVLPGSGGSVGRARILREAQAIARLSHPNVVTVHDVGTRVEQVFVAMELVDGVTLSVWLQQSARTSEEILGIFIQAGRGLAAAHRAGLVHRDFKPDNVLVGVDGRARVVDFGLVREVERPADEEPDTPVPSEPVLAMQLTQAGSVMGTPAYMAPEQFSLGRATDARSDQYSFCVALFEALAGVLPFAGADLASTAELVLSGEVPEIGGERKVPAHVRAAIRRGMSRRPADRFRSMDELLAVLAHDRRVGRRRLAAIAAAVAIAGAAVAVPLFARDSSSGARPCSGGPERVASAWGAPRRAALERAFAATGTPYAADSARAAARGLDHYAADWVKSWRDSCEATRVRGEQSAELQDLRAVCLARHRGELDALVDLLVAADARTVQRAVAAVDGLPPADECDDLAALEAPIPPPRGAAARREVEAVRAELARVDATVLAGRYKEALPAAEALRVRAHAIDYRPLEAETELLVGQVLGRSGDPEGAVGRFRAALAAATAGRHDELAVRALTYLVQSAADAQEFARGLDWHALGEAAVERIGDPPRRRAALHNALGYLLSRQGKHAEAAAQHQKALAIRQRISPTSFETARSLMNVAFSYDELGRYAEARAMAERAVAIEIAVLGPNHTEIATCYNNLGNIASDEGDLARAEGYYRRALAIRETTVKAGDDPGNLADVLNNLGIVALQRHRLDEALDYSRRTLAVREQIDPEGPDYSVSLTNLAAVEVARGRVGEALADYRRALAIAEKSLGKDHPFVGDALQGIGECTRRLGKLAESQAALERALAIRRAGARPIELADAELGLAQTVWQRGGRARALELARAARARYAGDPAAAEKLGELDDWLRSRPTR